jgi:hypothetical protein
VLLAVCRMPKKISAVSVDRDCAPGSVTSTAHGLAASVRSSSCMIAFHQADGSYNSFLSNNWQDLQDHLKGQGKVK